MIYYIQIHDTTIKLVKYINSFHACKKCKIVLPTLARVYLTVGPGNKLFKDFKAQEVYFQMNLNKISFGTYRIKSPETISLALDYYSSIDTAQVYKNHFIISDLLSTESISNVSSESASNIPIERNQRKRSEYFITTKLSPKAHLNPTESIRECLNSLKLNYIDLVLIHWPGTQKLSPSDPQNKINRLNTFNALLEAQKQGLIRHIGVSNYTKQHLLELPVPPFLNQVEFHPLLYTDEFKELMEYCQSKNIILQAYSPLGEGKLLNAIEYPLLQEIATRHEKSIAQILIKWILDKNVYVVVKASTKERMMENLNVFDLELSPKDVEYMDSMAISPKKFCWDPSVVL